MFIKLYRNSILLHSGLNPTWHFWLSTKYQNIETFMETQNLSLLLERGFYFVSKGPVISKKFIGFKNLMSWSGANQSKEEQKIANYNFFNQQQTSIKNWSCCYIHKKVQQLKLDLIIEDYLLTILVKPTKSQNSRVILL